MLNRTKWTIDPSHSEINFKVRHLMIAHVKGDFKKFEASITTDGKDFETAKINLTIESDSITTGDAKRDGHLKGPDFFDTSKYRQITFESTGIEKTDAEGNFEMWGELTMKGVTKVVKMQVRLGGIAKDPMGNEKAGFTIKGKLNRTDWGLNWNSVLEAGGVLVSEEVNIYCDIELINAGIEQTLEDKEPVYLNHKV